MNRLFTKTVAVFSATVMSLSGALNSFTALAEETADNGSNLITVEFDFVMDTSIIQPNKIDKETMSSINDFASFTTENTGYIKIPKGTFHTETHDFSGWTADGIIGYESGDIYIIPQDFEGDKITLNAVWLDTNESRTINVKYNMEFEGKELERPEWLKDTKHIPGMIFEPNYTSIVYDDLISNGLTDGVNNFTYGTKLVVPDHDITFTPIWRKKIFVTYFAGDVDRLNGNDTVVFEKLENGKDELAAADRFSRNGFNLVGWKSSLDGTIYTPGKTIVMPGEDVTFTAVWEAKEYVVVFSTGNGGASVKVNGFTDTKIVCPDPNHTVAGKHFGGWKDKEGVIYQPGDEYLIKGAIPGGGISLKGVWLEGDAPETPVTTAPPVAPVTTTTAEPVVTQPVTSSVAIVDYAPKFEYDTTPLKVGETREITVLHPVSGPAKIHSVTAPENVSYKYDGSKLEITALSAGETVIYVHAEGCAFSNSFTLTIVPADASDKPEVTLIGDANLDGKVTLADATAILQSLANPDKYVLSEQGAVNADCYNTGDGISTADALAIKKLYANVITSLPEISGSAEK